MAYGTLRDPGYSARLADVQADQKQRAEVAAEHVKAVLSAARAGERQADSSAAYGARIATALERIARALERANPEPPTP